MGSVVRRVLVLLVLGLATVVVAEAPVHAAACPCAKSRSLAQQINGASDVFSGTVTMATGPTNAGKRQVMSYDVKVDRVYKGDITTPQVTIKTDADATACGMTPLTADNRYLFFVKANGSNLRAYPCGGTTPATSAKTQKLVALLGPGQTPTPPTPEPATWNKVANAEPRPLTRLAAPGAALLVVGLLGLMLFGVLGRARRA